MMRSQDGDKRPGRKGSTRWTCQTRPASPAQPCWSASAPFLINFCSFSDLILVLFWSIAGQFCWLNSGEDAVSLVKCSTVFCVFCKGAVSHVQCSSTGFCLFCFHSFCLFYKGPVFLQRFLFVLQLLISRCSLLLWREQAGESWKLCTSLLFLPWNNFSFVLFGEEVGNTILGL